jgi:hypothetical protein
MPEPGGLSLVESVSILERLAREKPIAGAGFSGLAADPGSVAGLSRLCAALGL